MREIKFRGKSLNTNMWVYGDFRQDKISKKAYIEYEVDQSTIGQYTGLKDKDGKEIYDGDILADNECAIGAVEIIPRNGVVIKRRLGATFSIALRSFTYDSDFDIGQLSELKIIGNVYDNPELIK